MNEHDAIDRIKRLSHSINCADEIAGVIERLIKERDEARQQVRDIHRPDIAMCKVCENWTDAMVMCYPNDFQDEEETK